MTRTFRSRAKNADDREAAEKLHAELSRDRYEEIPASLAIVKIVSEMLPRRRWVIQRPPVMGYGAFDMYIMESDRGETLTYGDLWP